MAAPDWLAALEPAAPDVVAVWRLIDTDFRAARRAMRHRAGPGSAERVLAQQEAVADALESALAGIPDEMLRAPGGEEDWNVAQTFAHTTGARRWLVRASAWAALGTWPTEVPAVVPGVPGKPDADRETLLTLLAKSRRSMAESAAAIAGCGTFSLSSEKRPRQSMRWSEMSWAKLEKCGSSDANSTLCTVNSPPCRLSPAPGVGVLPAPLSSLHAANATTAITAIAASSHNHRYLRGRFIACLL